MKTIPMPQNSLVWMVLLLRTYIAMYVMSLLEKSKSDLMTRLQKYMSLPGLYLTTSIHP